MSGLGSAIAAVVLALFLAFVAVKGAGLIAAESVAKTAVHPGGCAKDDGSGAE
jgi:hypothetical protein